MIYINRSTDLEKDSFWVAAELNEETRRCRQLYLGKDVNGAVAAAVAAGLPKQEAISMAETAKAREQVVDDVRAEPDFSYKPAKGTHPFGY
jgi:hypothetical protein